MFNSFNANLRPFMDEVDSGGGGVATSQETTSTESTDTSTDTATESTESVDTADQSEGTTADSVDTKPKQTPEQNAAFADLRRKADAAERRASIAKKYGQYGVYSDADISEKFGKSHGVHNAEQLEEALRNEEHLNRQEALRASGVDPDLLNKFVDEHPAIQKAREQEQRTKAYEQAMVRAQEDNFLVSSFGDLQKEYPEIKEVNDVPPDVWRVWRNGSTGLTLNQAYIAVEHKNIVARQSEAAKQAALNNIQGKNHVRGNGKGVEGETVRIPDDVMEMYKKFNPGKTMDEYKAHYKKSQK